MVKLMCIAGGGAAGAVARYAVCGAVHRWLGSALPWGTLCVNLAGSFLIGVLAAMCELAVVSPNVRLLLMTGLLGAFTTFSAFSLETVRLLDEGRWTHATTNVGVSCATGIMMVLAGMFVARQVAAVVK